MQVDVGGPRLLEHVATDLFLLFDVMFDLFLENGDFRIEKFVLRIAVRQFVDQNLRSVVFYVSFLQEIVVDLSFQRRIENLFFDHGVDFQLVADFTGDLSLARRIACLFVTFEQVFHLAVIGLQDVGRIGVGLIGHHMSPSFQWGIQHDFLRSGDRGISARKGDTRIAVSGCLEMRQGRATGAPGNRNSSLVRRFDRHENFVLRAMKQTWPETLWVIRHGQSAGNVARDDAHARGLSRIELTHRDVDVPLSQLGREQAKALGRAFAAQDASARPEIVLSSPYVRAVETAKIFRDNGGCVSQASICIDERLREKEFGILDGLTAAGIREFHPEQAEFRALMGKFYHRPPGGESWVDVIFRLRALLDSVSLHHGGRRVLIVAHQVVVLCLRYIIEGLSEAEILEIDRREDVANCAITEYRFRNDDTDGKLELVRYNVTKPMTQDHTTVTTARDQMVAARG